SIGENVSFTLPLTVAGQIEVANASESLFLTGNSEFGLFTFSKTNLSNAPKILEPLTGTLAKSPDFYYTYVKGDLLLKTELALSNGKSFRIGIQSEDFSHRQFQVKTDPAQAQDQFQPVDFELFSYQVNLGENGYPETLFPYNLTELPISQKETSGLQWIQGRLFSINDGGNQAEIYELNPQSGALLRTVKVTNAPNLDWEDLAASATHLYVGDFGNNLGNRSNLRVLRIPATSLLNQTEVSAEIIEFSYPDQSDFSGTNPNHNFDCEAMVFAENQLHLFSKNLGDGRSKHYTLSSNPGKHFANLQGSFDAKGLITGADISTDGKNIVLLGYENKGTSSRAFLWTFGAVSGSIFSGLGNQFFLGSPAILSQTEGIALDPNFELKIAGEQINLSGLTVPPKMFELDLGGIFTP
ncbi:MAG TPA: hypothetical protein VLA71_04200, partial [Algoriphagus sp.]|nr:hypothetical protein [Algoriphagus sp.]